MGKTARTWRDEPELVNSLKHFTMPVPFKIHVTKQIIAQCKEVGVLDDVDIIGDICPIAIAIKDLFPEVHVSNQYIFPLGMNTEAKIPLPKKAQEFINEFDSLSISTDLRLHLPALEFEIQIPDEVIETISIAKDITELQFI